MHKRAVGSVLLMVLAATAVGAQKQRITLKSGREVVGEVVERTKEGVKVKTKIAVVFYPADQVKSIEPVRSVGADYAGRLAAIDKDDPDAHVKLGAWAMEREMYKRAVERFEAALKLDKDHERASLLLRTARAKLEAVGDGEDGEDGEPSPTTSKLPFQRKRLLNEEGIYRIRIVELDEKDRVRVRFRNDVIDRFIKQRSGRGKFEDPAAARQFRRLDPARQVHFILDTVARDDRLLNDIQVETDPRFMIQFRKTIWRWVAGSCASVQCHGSRKGKGGLKLFNFAGYNDRVDYTNFLILDSWHKKGGLQMIRRDEPEQSLLLHYGLPARLAIHKHPKEVTPSPLKSKTSSAYKATLEWIKSLAGPPHPRYNIKNRPPDVMAPPTGLPGLPDAKPRPKAKKKNARKGDDSPF